MKTIRYFALAVTLVVVACGETAPAQDAPGSDGAGDVQSHSTPEPTEALPFTVVVESTARVPYVTPTPTPVLTFEEQEATARAESKARERERTWGDGTWDGAGDFLSVSVGAGFACGLRSDGGIECWGGDRQHVEVDVTPPEGRFDSLSVGPGYACATGSSDGLLVCWGSAYLATAAVANWMEDYYAGPTFYSVSTGRDIACGLLIDTGFSQDGALFCWGKGFWGAEKIAEGGEFTSVGVGTYAVCGVRPDRTLACWGGEEDGWINANHPGDSNLIPPEGEFDSISMGSGYRCGVKTDGSVACWGYDSQDRIGLTPQGAFESVSVGYRFVCGIRPGGSIECWGGYPVPPFGEFASVSTSRYQTFACGMRPAGGVICWDRNGAVEGPSTAE